MKKIVIIFLAALSLSSCGSYKRLAYLQDMNPWETYDITQRANPRIAIGDELTITVSSSFPQLVAPFNVTTATSTYDAVTQAESYKNVNDGGCVYKVGKDGKIDFPVLGSIYVEGSTPDDLKAMIEDAIKAKNYVSDPTVSVKFSNFNVYVLGEVNGVGPLEVPSGGINVLQALSMAGDLTEDAIRDNIWVIRTTGDTRKVFTLNLKSRSVFDSPAFYLQQDDILYVAPKDTKRDSQLNNVFSTGTMILTTLSTIVSFLLMFVVLTK